MELSDFFDQAPRLRPFLNIGCLMDIPTGRYYEGNNGEMILNGGWGKNWHSNQPVKVRD